MSGGVDSSVAAALLLESGFDVVGVTQKLWCYGEDIGPAGRTCCSLEALNAARQICSELGIRHYVLDFQQEFRQDVLLPFLETYLNGQTPNPCVWCNSRIRFSTLLQKMASVGSDLFATGHYCRVGPSNGGHSLYRAVDRWKDQSYFLWNLDRDILGRLVFPLGELRKESVREKARSLRLPVAERAESQDLCFGGGGRIRDVLRVLVEKEGLSPARSGLKPGPIVMSSGVVLGTHNGTAGFTIGQRRKLAVSHSQPLYVVRIEPEKSTVVVGTKEELFRDSFEITQTNWFGNEHVAGNGLRVKIRYRKREIPCTLEAVPGGYRVHLSAPQAAITPGQSAVFYENDRLVGGGIIASL